jgi:hypothetical protein
MVSIAADNLQVERSLRKIVALSEKAGAEFSDDLVLKSVNGYLSVEAPPESAGKVLVRLPWDCLVPFSPFRLSIVNDDLAISSYEEGLTDECVVIMEALLELFNLTRKVAHHRRTSPWRLIISYPTILKCVRQGRDREDFALFEQFIVSGGEDELMLQSFLNSRVLGYKASTTAPPYPVLMPVIDLFNHHFQGALFQIDEVPDKERSLAIARSMPLPGTGTECFACYGAHDSFDTWVTYGFVDQSALFVRSVAMTIDLPNLGTIRLTNFDKTRDRRALPPSVSDLRFYIPALLARRADHIEVGRLLIPGPSAPRALRRTLHFLIAEMSPGHSRQRDLVMEAERQIITANKAYYRDLVAFLRTLCPQDPLQKPILRDFIHMSELQLARIWNYLGYAKG